MEEVSTRAKVEGRIVVLILLAVTVCVLMGTPTLVPGLSAALSPLWLEWSVTELGGVRIGLMDVLIAGGAMGLAFHRSPVQYGSVSRRISRLVGLYLVLILLCFPINHSGIGFPKMVWGMYKETYMVLPFFVYLKTIHTVAHIRRAVWCLLLGASVCAAIGIVQVKLQEPWIPFGVGIYGERIPLVIDQFMLKQSSLRAFGTLWHPNAFGAFLVWPFMITATLLLVPSCGFNRRYLGMALALQGVAIVMSFSRGVWMGLGLALILMAVIEKIHRHRHARRIAVGVILMALVAVFVAPSVDLLPGNVRGRLVSMKDKDDPAMLPRYARWGYFFDKSMERPLTGHGVVTDQSTSDLFLQDAPTPHNTLLHVAMRWGYVVLVIILVIIARFAGCACRLQRVEKDGFLHALGVGAFCGLLGLYLVSSMFGVLWEEDQIQILFWLVLAWVCRATDLCGKDRNGEGGVSCSSVGNGMDLDGAKGEMNERG